MKEFLTFLAVKRRVPSSTQNQAFNALLFFFRHVLKKEFAKVDRREKAGAGRPGDGPAGVLCASWGLQQVAIKVTNPAVPALLYALCGNPIGRFGRFALDMDGAA